MSVSVWGAAAASPPAVSVVVPTFRRADRLPRLLAALAAQDLRDPFEVVVVDDCSPDDTQAVLRASRDGLPFALRVLRPPVNGGAANARNLGWRAATSDLIAFTDDDCCPTPGWLRAVVDGLREADVVQGRTAPDPGHRHRLGAFSHTMDIPGPSPFYETCNIAYRREVLDKVDGFDTTYRISGEDTDLAHRAIAAGATVAFDADALVLHEIKPSSFRASIAKAKTYDGLVRAVLTYPELRHHFDGRYLWYRRQALALAALAGVVVALPTSRRPRARQLFGAALALPYARHRLRREPLSAPKLERMLRLPQTFVFDLIEWSYVTRALWRYRSLR